MKGWLDKYNDGGPIQPNYNDSSASAGPDFEGDGTFNKGRNYSPAWGGQFKDGGPVKRFMQPTETFKNLGYNPKENEMSTEYSTSIGGPGEVYLVPGYRQGRILQDPEGVFNAYGEHLGGPFKTVQAAEDFGKLRHQYVEKNQNIPAPFKTKDYAMGGSMPGTVGFMYARTQDPAPSKGKYAKKTMASAEDGAAIENNNTKTDLDIYNEIKHSLNYNKNTIDKNTVLSIKKEMGNYINSPLYAQRQSNYPEKYSKIIYSDNDKISYINKLDDLNEQKKYETSIAKSKKEQRLHNLNNVPFTIHEKSITPDELRVNSKLANVDDNFYDPNLERLNLSKRNFPAVVAHELTHASARPSSITMYDPNSESRYPESDKVNTKYWDSITNEKKKSFNIGTGLNISEVNEFINLANPLTSPQFTGDTHTDKASERTQFTNEQYGDLNAMRYLLYNKGITKSFGENLDKGKLQKALKNEQIRNDPNFKRFHFRYGTDNVIKLNNTIAANDSQQGVPIAENGAEMQYYQEGLDFKPKSISRDGSQLVKLDQLTNFTNYNTKQPGGWLDKYQ